MVSRLPLHRVWLCTLLLSAGYAQPCAAADPIILAAANTSARSPQWLVLSTELSYWNANVWVEYQMNFSPGGSWTLGATGINHNNASAPGLPAGYAFNLTVAVDGVSQGSLTIPGSTTTYQTSTKTLALAAGSHTIRLTWTNDAYSAGNYDANLRLKEVAFTPPQAAPVATPSMTPPGGAFTGSVQVSLATATAEAQIRYTLDGTTPTAASLLYTTSFTLTQHATVKAKAFKAGSPDSAMASADFTLATGSPPAGLVIPASQTFTRSPSWQVSSGTQLLYWSANVWLEYRVDFGSGGLWSMGLTAINKNNASAPGLPPGYAFHIALAIDGVAQGSLNVPGSTTTYQTGTTTRTLPAGVHTIRFTWTNDAYSTGAYDANIQVKEVSFSPPVASVATPTIAPLGGTFEASVVVSLATATAEAQIRYTTDGGVPGIGSPIYTEPFTIASTSVVTARAVKAGLADSALASAAFAIIPPPPPGGAIVLPATQTSSRSPQWQVSSGMQLSYWNANVWLEYQVVLPSGGSWDIGLAARNQNNASAPDLPPGYAFHLEVLMDGAPVGSFDVPGSTTAVFQTGKLTQVLLPGPHTLRFTWTNDAYSAGLYDANIRVKEIFCSPVALDTDPPVITDVATTEVTAFGATVTWVTDELARSVVDFGPTPAYGQTTPQDPTLRTHQRIALVDLPPGVPHFRVRSQDAFGNEAIGNDEMVLISAPDPLNPTVSFTSPPQNAPLAVGPVLVVFDVQHFAVEDQGQPHLHIYVDGNPEPMHFYNGLTQDVHSGGVHTHAIHWASPVAAELLGLSPGLHQAHVALADAADQDLIQPEARRTLQLMVQAPGAGELSLELFASGLLFPAFFAFAPDGRLFYTELPTGQIRIIQPDGQLQEQPFYQLNAQPNAGRAVYGIAIDTDFEANQYVYVAYGLPGTPLVHRVVRLTDVDGQGTEETTIIDGLPSGPIHNVEALHFGPDGKLYLSLGDLTQSALAQDVQSPAGKILRYNPDGSIPADNPFAGSPVYLLGLRNSFDFAFHPHTGDLWISENGPEVDDELNRGVAGGNYGWPTVTGIANHPGFVDPMIALTPTVGPTGLIALGEDSSYPEAFHNNLFWADYNHGKIYRIRLGGTALTELASFSTAYPGGQGFLLSFALGPDGYAYVSNEQAIFRVVPTTP